MKGTPRIVVTVAIAAVGSMVFAGCTSTKTDTTASAGGAKESALKTIQQSGTVRVADCLSFAPFGFKDASGNPDGYDIDIAKAMAKDLGVKLQVVDTSSANRIPNLQTNKVDVVICNFTRNGERQKQVEFTDPYVVASEALLVKKSSSIQKVQDVVGKTIATVKGSTNADILKKLGINVKTQEFDTSQAAILAVRQGQADAMIEDSNFLAYQAKLDPTLRVTKEALIPPEYNAFGVQQGDQIWLNWLNGFLFRYNASGANKAAYEKWFGVSPQYPLNPQY
ncbi:MAG: ABC transporter substrate-binding protein [Dermatophilaceae bacterium]